MTIIWCMAPKILSAMDRIFCHFGPFFALFTLQKIKILKNWKKIPGDIILHKCTKNNDHMLCFSLDMARNGFNYFPFWAFFFPFYLPNSKKKSKFFKKMKKTPGDIITSQQCTTNHHHMLYCSWVMVCDGCNYFSFSTIFCPLTPLTAQKIKI